MQPKTVTSPHKCRVREKEKKGGGEVIYTVFPEDPNRMPQDFPSYEEAKEYGDKYEEEYTIESTTGECE